MCCQSQTIIHSYRQTHGLPWWEHEPKKKTRDHSELYHPEAGDTAFCEVGETGEDRAEAGFKTPSLRWYIKEQAVQKAQLRSGEKLG